MPLPPKRPKPGAAPAEVDVEPDLAEAPPEDGSPDEAPAFTDNSPRDGIDPDQDVSQDPDVDYSLISEHADQGQAVL